jgi:hypothetical protein
MTNFSTKKRFFYYVLPLLLFSGVQTIQAQQAKYRTIDGTNNNLTNIKWGSAGIPLFREIPAEYGASDPNNALGGVNRPTARHISNALSDEVEDIQNARNLSGLTYIWGQFLDHDITLTPGGGESAPISLPAYEPIFTNPIPFRRSAIHPGTGVTSPRDQSNIQTSWIDGSQIYGANAATASWLRTFKDGKLKVSAGNLLPFNTLTGEFDSPLDLTAPKMDDDNNRTKKTFAAGDPRAAEHPGLTCLHTLFLREHNRICDALKSKALLSDEEIYQKARKEVGALLQAITYGQWVNALGVSPASYSGYKPTARPDISNLFSTASYRWHTMVENDIIFRNNECNGVGPVELPLKNVFFTIDFVRKFDIGILLKGLSVHQQYETDLKVNNGLRNFLFGQGSGLDLASINIQRGRDHGLPNYNKVRKFYTGSTAASFSDIASNSKVASKMQTLFGNVDNIDLWVGLYAESLLSGKSLGKTVDAVLRSQLEKLRDGDFYYYMNDPELALDRTRLSSTTLADLIARNSNSGAYQANVFIRKECAANGDDLNDNGEKVCTGTACTVKLKCNDKAGIALTPGTYTLAQLVAKGIRNDDISQIDVNIGFAVILYESDNFTGKSVYYSTNTECLPLNWDNQASSLKVICLSNDPSTVNCAGFGGSLFSDCFGSGVPISAGTYTAEQLTALSVTSNTISGIRINNGFSITLYNGDNFTGQSVSFTGPTVTCLPALWDNAMKSVKVTCLSNPAPTTCAGGVAGGIFDDCDHEGISVGLGDYNSTRLIAMGMPLKAISKVLMTNGYAITLFEKDDFTGRNVTYTGKICLSTLWSNTASAIRVSCLAPVQALVQNESFVLSAVAEPNRARIEWISNTGFKTDYYTVEKFNGTIGDFEPMATENAVRSESAQHYVVYDDAPQEGDNIYRIKISYQDGSRQVSENKVVNFKGLSDVLIFPNPAHSAFNIDLTDYKNQPVEITLYNTIGQLVLVHKVAKVGNSIVELDVANQEAGNYRVRIQSKNKRDIIKPLVIAR